jgi:hypothetical protein
MDDPVMIQQGLSQQGCRHTKGDALPAIALNISGPGRRTDHYQRESASQHHNDKAFGSHDVPPFVMRFICLDTGRLRKFRKNRRSLIFFIQQIEIIYKNFQFGVWTNRGQAGLL